MIDFPIGELLDDRICLIWLERHLHADGFKCPRCGCTERRLFRGQGPFPASRCRACDGYYTLLTGTVFAKSRQRPATLVLLREIAKGKPTARLARELGVSRKQLHTLRQRIQAHLNDTVPTGVMTGTTFEADELYQNAGKKSTPHRDPTDHALVAENVPLDRTILYTDEWQSYRGSHMAHATVYHSSREWARNDDGDGVREVHCNTCEGAGAALRTYLRAFRGLTSSTCTCMLPPMKPWSMPKGSRPS